MPGQEAQDGVNTGAGGGDTDCTVQRYSVAPGSSRLNRRRRRSALLPSVLTFAVIVASGGLLLLIEKGMLNTVSPPSPLSNSRKAQHRHPAVDVESQVN